MSRNLVSSLPLFFHAQTVFHAAIGRDVLTARGLTDHFTREETKIQADEATSHVTQGIRSKVWNLTEALGHSVMCSFYFAS